MSETLEKVLHVIVREPFIHSFSTALIRTIVIENDNTAGLDVRV